MVILFNIIKSFNLFDANGQTKSLLIKNNNNNK